MGVAWGAPIPLTIKQFEEEERRKTMANGALDSWDHMRAGLNSSSQQQPSSAMSADDVWEVWVPLRYQLHTKKLAKPTLPELRKAMRDIKVSYNGC